jgi:DNA (cytosine-5)-methyltransferase 1
MKYELVNFCEFDSHASKAYSLIHNESESKNLGDITRVNEKEITDFNMMVGGSPCQDFSVAGKKEGAVWTCNECGYEYNPLEAHYSTRNKCPKCSSINIEKTRSSLLVEWLRVLREKKPNLAIYENVKNIIGKQFKYTFGLFEKELNEYGYNTYWKVLNAKDYDIPQNRERIYLIIIKKELDNGLFKFPKAIELKRYVNDFKEEKKDILYAYLTEKQKSFILDMSEKQLGTKWDGRTNNGLLNPTIIKTLQTKGKARQRCHVNTFFVDDLPDNTTAFDYKNNYMTNYPDIRYLTSLERFRLMGFDDKDYYILLNNNFSENQMNLFTGNSIVVDVLYYILLEIYKVMPYLLEDIKLSSFFSGIGAFEKAIIRLQNYVNNINP